MIFQNLKNGIPVTDRTFDQLFPPQLRQAAAFHFTPVAVAQLAAKALVTQAGTQVLDIGSGAGKFCLIGAAATAGFFTGVEQRESLHQLAQQLAIDAQLPNLAFVHANITSIDFQAFDAFYFFNAFYEHRQPADQIDASIPLQRQLYDVYALAVKQQLATLPLGTRLATYFSYADEIPPSYQVITLLCDGYLKIWQKMS